MSCNCFVHCSKWVYLIKRIDIHTTLSMIFIKIPTITQRFDCFVLIIVTCALMITVIIIKLKPKSEIATCDYPTNTTYSTWIKLPPGKLLFLVAALLLEFEIVMFVSRICMWLWSFYVCIKYKLKKKPSLIKKQQLNFLYSLHWFDRAIEDKRLILFI